MTPTFPDVCSAIRLGDNVAIATQWLPTSTPGERHRLLCIAAECNRLAVATLLKPSVDLATLDPQGRIPPFYAASTEMVALLGYQETVDSHGNNPLMYAVRVGSINGARGMIRAGAYVNARNLRTGATAAHFAAARSTGLVRTVVHGNGSLVTKDDQGCTPVHVAALAGNPATVAYMLGKIEQGPGGSMSPSLSSPSRCALLISPKQPPIEEELPTEERLQSSASQRSFGMSGRSCVPHRSPNASMNCQGTGSSSSQKSS